MAQTAAIRKQNARYLKRRRKMSEKGYPKKDGPHFIKHGLTARQKSKRTRHPL